ncbi:uncharacterized protein I206_104858 [Kwoniella pini CBS 10737]|uniref:JmjC domain-containing protein n=1 Tax=Kwoniella pini CBS 10737 TaxID=1296096 RepID=A0A1B9I848_9TREE|nr:uncharacterized protein I206_02398 [Kwoniella pini CBS 10737]OCF51683.1 hypothetical protein I206_02398 [Kwoniella pini CBS 10737]
MVETNRIEILENALEQLLDDYRDLQIHGVTNYDVPPSSLEALRMIHRAHPSVIHGFSPLSEAAQGNDWTKTEIYESISGNNEVTVAITDDGLADSVRELGDGSTTFVKALDVKMTMSNLISKLSNRSNDFKEAYYLQSQDGNIYRSTPRPYGPPELDSFQKYIKKDIGWMKDATGSEAEAVNLWIGDKRSTTSLHHDPYENIYHVLAGKKIFTLISPIEGLWLDQQFHKPSTLQRSPSGHLTPVPDEDSAYPIPWVSSTEFPSRIQPLRVELCEGETLYLPANWWHRVEQEEGDSGIVVAVNYWYPAEIHPQIYAYERLSRRIARLTGREGVIPVPGDQVPDDIWGEGDSGEEWDPAEWGR